MNSKLSPSKPLSRNLSVTSKFQKGKLSGKAAVTKTAVETNNPIPIVTKKPFTTNDKELLEACEAGDIDKVYAKLWDKANVNCKRPVYGSTPLAVACRKGYHKIVNVLLEFGATMSSDDFGCSPLHWAANSGKPQIISSLIKKAHLSIGDLQKKDQFGSTALHFASVRSLTENVQTLISAGSNPLITNNDGKKPSEVTSSVDIRELLLEKEQKLEQATKNSKKINRRKSELMLKMQPVMNSKLLNKPLKRSLPQLKTEKPKNYSKKTDSAKKPDSATVKPQTPSKTTIQTKSFSPK